jgi:group I intron endonuclease
MSISVVYKIINDIDDKVYIGSTTSTVSKRITEHRRRARNGGTTKFYQHMRNIGIEHFKIVCIREYTDITKTKLHAKEDKYIRRFDSVRNGLNTNAMSGYYCMHDKQKRICRECDMGKNLCIHDKVRYMCVVCKGKGICIHTKIKNCCKLCNPMTCNRCGKNYAGKGNLTRHQIKCQIDQSNVTE